MEFLEERYPGAGAAAGRSRRPRLRPAPHLPRRRVDRSVLRFRRGEEARRGVRRSSSRRFDAMLAERPYLGGAEYSHADIAFVPWVLRARDMLGVDLEPYPALYGLARAARGAARDRGRSRGRRRAVNSVVDAAWLAEHLGEDDLVVGDVRGPNAHMRGHIPGSRPLVLGSPPPGADEDDGRARSRRRSRCGCGGTGSRVASGSCSSTAATASARCRRAQMAELAGHPSVAVLLGGMAGWEGDLEEGAVELEPVREAELEPNPRAMPTRQELASRLDDASLTVLDVRTPDEYSGPARQPVRPAPGAHPGRAEPRGRGAVRGAGTPGVARASPRARRACPRATRGRRVLPLRLALGAGHARAPRGRLRRAQLRRLLARVEPPRRAAARALADPRLRRKDARPREWLSAWSVGRSERLPTSGRRPSVTV